MPDRFGRPTSRELRSTALMTLSEVWATTAEDPNFKDRLQMVIRRAKMAGASSDDILSLLLEEPD